MPKPTVKLFMLSALSAALAMPTAQAAFVEDSTASLGLRNFYMNRDYRDRSLPGAPVHKGKTQSKSEDWGQAFMLRYQSGFTEGTIGVGLDALGLWGVKLDSGGGTGGTGALVRHRRSGRSADQHGSLGVTFKAKLGETVLTAGAHEPLLPIAFRNDTRLMPQTFRGVQLQSKDIDRLTLTAGQFQRSRFRDSTNSERMGMFADGATGGTASSRFNYAGAAYTPIEGLTGTYYFAELKNNYRQHHANIQHLAELAPDWKLKTDLRYFRSTDRGNTNVDNRMGSGMLTLGYRGHWLGLGYQKSSGKTGMPFLGGGTDPWTMNTLTYHHFLRAKEKGWQARYDYDFAQVGIPGLNLMARYVRGSNFKIGGSNATEWERDVDLGYTVQSGPLKNVGVLLRNVAYRGSHTTNIDENRLIISYTFKFL